ADISICSQICRLGVAEHGLDSAENVNVDIEYAMDNYEPWFVRIQPKMTVPVVKYDDQVIGDSREILFFLAERHPGLYPDASQQAISQFIDSFYHRFGQIGLFTFSHFVQRSPEMRDFVARAKGDVTKQKLQALAETDEFRELAQAKLKAVEGRDLVSTAEAQDLDALDASMKTLLEHMDEELKDGRTFLFGDSYTLADVVATAYCARLHFVLGDRLFPTRVCTYWESVKARPTFTSANICSVWEDALMAKQFADFVEQRAAAN
ncbi:MAG: glutathione S-transferase family protein, partial [Myxococcota bacterium]